MNLATVFYASRIVSILLSEKLSPSLSYKILKLAEEMNKDLSRIEKIRDDMWNREKSDIENNENFLKFLETEETLNVYNKIPLHLIEQESFKIEPNMIKLLIPFLEE